MHRFMIELDDDTFTIIAQLATGELRHPSQQAAWMLMQAAKAWTKQQAALKHLEGATVAPADTEEDV